MVVGGRAIHPVLDARPPDPLTIVRGAAVREVVWGTRRATPRCGTVP